MEAMSTQASAGALRAALPLRLAFVWSTPLRRAFLVTASWRVLVGVWGVVAHGMVRPGPYAANTLMHRGWPANPFTYVVDAGVRMDAFWYAGIVRHGYTYSTHNPSSIVFYPLFPAVVKVLSLATGSVFLAGMIVPTICLFLAVLALQAWLDARGAGKASALAMGLILCFPFGFFWASMYTESLFLALALATFVFFERGSWQLSAVCAFLAVLCRPTGLVLAPCLAAMLLVSGSKFQGRLKVQGSRFKAQRPETEDEKQGTRTQFKVQGSKFKAQGAATGYEQPQTRNQKPETRNPPLLPWFAVFAGPFAYACFAAYQWIALGTPFASVNAEAVRPFSRDFSQAISDLMLRRPGFPPWYLAALLVIGVVFLAAVPWVYRRFGLPYALFAALVVLFPMTLGLTSLERYVMVDFPVFAALAMVGRRVVPVTLMITGFYAMLGFMALFVAGYTLI